MHGVPVQVGNGLIDERLSEIDLTDTADGPARRVIVVKIDDVVSYMKHGGALHLRRPHRLQAVADEVVRIVGLPKGKRPMRPVIDFIGDGAKEVLEVSERVRIEFAERIGMADLLEANVSA